MSQHITYEIEDRGEAELLSQTDSPMTHQGPSVTSTSFGDAAVSPAPRAIPRKSGLSSSSSTMAATGSQQHSSSTVDIKVADDETEDVALLQPAPSRKVE